MVQNTPLGYSQRERILWKVFPVKSLRWIFSRKYLRIFSRFLLSRKAPSRIIGRVLNTRPFCVYCLGSVCDNDMVWLKAFTKELNECHEYQNQNLGKLVYRWILERDSVSISLIFKNAWSVFFFLPSSNFQCQEQNVKKFYFIPVKAKFSSLSIKTMGLLLSPRHPLYRRVCIHTKKIKIFIYCTYITVILYFHLGLLPKSVSLKILGLNW